MKRRDEDERFVRFLMPHVRRERLLSGLRKLQRELLEERLLTLGRLQAVCWVLSRLTEGGD